MIIYIDTCCYGRPFDRPRTPEIRAEAKAIDAIITTCKTGGHRIIGSAIVSFEIAQIPNADVREKIETYYNGAIAESVPVATGRGRADFFEAHGVGEMDAAHLATAEDAGVDFLLTVDADFIRKCNQNKLSTAIVINPLYFLNGGYL
jgi:predicted nucleic acid-binding protein